MDNSARIEEENKNGQEVELVPLREEQKINDINNDGLTETATIRRQKRKKKSSTAIHSELWNKFCVKKFSGMSTKREVSCGQIIAMLTLFILGSLASHMVLLSTVVVWFVYEKERDSTLTPKQRSILVFKDALEIELITMAIGIVLSLIVGYMYEIWSRKKVLTICFCLLAIGMIIPESKIIDDTDALYAAGRMITAAIAQCIMQNPLINDYVKKHNRGWASALNTIGKEIGEITAFILIY